VNPLTTQRLKSTAPAAYLLVLLGLSLSPTSAQTPPSSGLGFSNPPLRYEGPDPTANQFLPADSAIPISEPSSNTVTPLPPAEFSASQFPTTTYPTSQAPPPRSLTPSEMTRRFSLPGFPLSEEIGLGLNARQPINMNSPYFADPASESEFIFPPGTVDDSGATLWARDELPPDGLLLYDGGITAHKEGFFQTLCLTGTWIDRNDKLDDFGIMEVDLKATFALPLPTHEWPLLVTSAFNTRFLDGPQVVALPPRVYETYVDFTWLPQLGARWTAIVGVAPSIYSDFEDTTDAFRVTGKGLIRYDWRPGTTQVILGVLYLGREDVTILPAGGIVWTPNDRQKYELLFPRPKLAHLIRREARHEDWLYLGAEFGGNSYAVERVPGTIEKITLRDYRAYLGLERKLNGGAGFRIEIGFVWGRVIEFASGLPDVKADDTAMIRGGITF
jgi:hypothetical protein